MTTYAKYSEQFQKRRAMKASSLERKMIPTDREAYTEFLEVQLEKVSNALLASKSLEEKLQESNTRIDDFGDKIVNITKLVKLLQDFTEAQEEENTKARDNVHKIQHEVNQRISILETGGDNYTEKNLEKKVERIQTIVEELASKDRNKKEEKSERIDSGYMLKIQQEELERAINDIRNEMAIRNENFEVKVENFIQKLSEDLASDVKTLETRMNDFMRVMEQEKFQEKIKNYDSSTQDPRLSNTEILGSMERFMKDFRDEINRKIEMVMMESRTGADVEFIKEAVDNIKHQVLIEKRDRQEAIDLLTDNTLRKESVMGSMTDDMAIRLEALERKLKSKSRQSDKSLGKIEEDEEMRDEFQAFKQKVYKEISEIKYTISNINKIDLDQSKAQGAKKRESFLREELEALDKKFMGVTDRMNEKLGSAISKNTHEILLLQDKLSSAETKGKVGSPLRTTEYLFDRVDKRNAATREPQSEFSDSYQANKRYSSKDRSVSGENSVGHNPAHFEGFSKENKMSNKNLQASFGKPKLSGAKRANTSGGNDEGPDTSNFRRSRYSKEEINDLSPDMVPSREINSKNVDRTVAGSTEARKKTKKKKSRKDSRASRSKSPAISSHSKLSNKSSRRRSLKRSLSASSINREKEKLMKGSFVFSPYSNRNSQNKEVVNRLALEKKMREEKIKQLVKKDQKGSAKENRSMKSNAVKQAATKHKNTLGKNEGKGTKKLSQNDSEIYTKNLKYDYNFVNTSKSKSNADKMRKLEKMYDSLTKE